MMCHITSSFISWQSVGLCLKILSIRFPLTGKIQELRFGKSQGILLVDREKQNVLSDWATVTVVLFYARSLVSYCELFGLDFVLFILLFLNW